MFSRLERQRVQLCQPAASAPPFPPPFIAWETECRWRTRMKETPLEYRDRLLSLVAPDDAWRVLESTSTRLRRAVTGRTLAELTWKPEPHRWSVAQILAHLSDTETVGAWRFRSLLGENGIALQAFDQDRWADAFRYEAADPFDSLELFAVTRAGTLRLLRRIDPALMNNFGVHAERGNESVSHFDPSLCRPRSEPSGADRSPAGRKARAGVPHGSRGSGVRATRDP